MTLTQLVYVVKIADVKSMNKAAAELFVPQPALSGAIREPKKNCISRFFTAQTGELYRRQRVRNF